MDSDVCQRYIGKVQLNLPTYRGRQTQRVGSRGKGEEGRGKAEGGIMKLRGAIRGGSTP